MNTLIFPALLLVCGADDVPAPKLPLGKDTTYVVGPLDKHGYIDYETALNAEMSKGITPDKNANALLIQMFGPAPEGGDGLPTAYFKWLDVPIPPKDGDYFLRLTDAPARLGITSEQLTALYEFLERVAHRPWAAKDCPPLAEWLRANERPLALAVEAVKRPAFFSPLVSRRKEGEPSQLLGTLIPTQRCREVGSALAYRATLRLGEKKYAAAWADILACHRLGRHLTYGGTLIETFVGLAICQTASSATLTYLDRADLTAADAIRCLKDLRGLRPVAPAAEKIGVVERIMSLDMLQLVRRGADMKLTAEERKAIDWTATMRVVNGSCDRVSAAMRREDRAEREKALEAIEKDFQELRKKGADEDFQQLLKDAAAGKATGKQIGEHLVGLMMPAFRNVQKPYDRCEQTERNLRVACALAAYRADAGKYPAQLADLAPKYLDDVPDDLFSGRDLIYKPEGKGYLLYSVGPNGTDDGGRGQFDDPPGDDFAVRMPLPEPKKK